MRRPNVFSTPFALAVLILHAAAPIAAEPAAEAESVPEKPLSPEEQARKTARAAYQEGDTLYAAGDWAGAYEKYEQANELVPSVNAAYWIAVCLDRMARSFEAALAYDAVLKSADVAKLGDQRVADVQARFEELRKVAVGTLKLATRPIARITIDGQPRGETPVELLLQPGKHELLLEADGHVTEKVEVALAPGKVLDEMLELKPVPPPAEAPAPPPPPAAPPPRPPERSMLPGYVMLGLTAVTVGTGTYFGIRALGAQSDFEDDPNDGDADDVEKFQMLSDLSFGAALTFGVTALVYMTYQPATETKPATARATPRFDLTPVASPRLAGATATLKF